MEIAEQRGVRSLHFGSDWIQGAMRIARPWALELEYTREMMLPLLLRGDEDWPASVLQVGLGAASVTKFLYRHRPAARITAVEIEPQVVAAARQFFLLPDDPGRIRIEVADAFDYVALAHARYDLILVDGFDARGRAGRLDSAPFYAACRERLARRGMVAVNVLTRRRSAAPSIARLREAFEERVLALPPSEPGNVVLLAAAGPAVCEPIEALRDAARAFKVRTGLDLLPTLDRLAHARMRVIRA